MDDKRNDNIFRVMKSLENMEKAIVRKSTAAPRSICHNREVWSLNLREELELLNEYLPEFPVVVIDMEFPGFLWCTPKGISEEEFYHCLRFNVNRLNILQLGLTLADQKGNIAMTWEFNFRDFDHVSDMEDVSSLDSFLKNKGFDFYKLKKYGIAQEDFTTLFLPICRSGQIKRWITFHGFYDITYLLKLLKIKSIPISMATFATTAQHLLGTVSDLKHMARYCDGLLDGNLGLKKLAKLLDVKRIDNAHFACSDNLFTTSVYTKMKQIFKLPLEQCEGFLYGLPYPINGFQSVAKIIDPSTMTPPPPLPSKFSILSFCSSTPLLVGIKSSKLNGPSVIVG
ncbi:putative CCR4-associated factor 1 homolog 8 [Momordica charantia]|uniref:poly(A)-specific ribonuclease n=1 Tax=Momordica charantia TaxID=3673 RepID=A0A6J1CXZ5_MOMCH|nr:putative CCR4-associated factor 1 homolog 8 [Momordica charantia]